jgi:hypothetical protein
VKSGRKGWLYLPKMGFELRLSLKKSRNGPAELAEDLRARLHLPIMIRSCSRGELFLVGSCCLLHEGVM